MIIVAIMMYTGCRSSHCTKTSGVRCCTRVARTGASASAQAETRSSLGVGADDLDDERAVNLRRRRPGGIGCDVSSPEAGRVSVPSIFSISAASSRPRQTARRRVGSARGERFPGNLRRVEPARRAVL